MGLGADGDHQQLKMGGLIHNWRYILKQKTKSCGCNCVWSSYKSCCAVFEVPSPSWKPCTSLEFSSSPYCEPLLQMEPTRDCLRSNKNNQTIEKQRKRKIYIKEILLRVAATQEITGRLLARRAIMPSEILHWLARLKVSVFFPWNSQFRAFRPISSRTFWEDIYKYRL